jgi:hypothetical protein
MWRLRNALVMLVVISLVSGLAVVSVTANAQEAATWTTPDNTPDNTPEIEGGGDALKKLAARPGLSFKQRRAMGITIRNIRLKMVEMKKDGRLDGVAQSDVAAMVLDELISDNPKAFADPSVDWDGLFAFIERLIPLILKIMALFGI